MRSILLLLLGEQPGRVGPGDCTPSLLSRDFFKGALQKIEARRQRNSGSGEMASTTRSEK